MAITVKFIGAFRGISGRSTLCIRVKEAVPLSKVVERVVGKQPKLRRLLIDPELEDPRPNTLILVNGKEISVLNGLDTIVENGDEVVFVPVVHGG
jgi:molybdopterin synthase sulfur carrier subunit